MKTEKIIGYILLSPALISLITSVCEKIAIGNVKATVFYKAINDSLWTGYLPIYYGLMAIAGAYLIKDKK